MVKSKAKIDSLMPIWIILFFIGDFLAKLSVFYFNNSFNRIGGVIKLLFLIYLLIYILKKFEAKIVLFIPLILLTILVIGQLSMGVQISDIILGLNKGNLYYLVNLVFIFFFVGALEISDGKELNFKKAVIIFEKLLLFNGLLIILGFFLNVEFFKTYLFSERWGFNGIFVKNGEMSYMYMILISILYHRSITRKENNIIKFVFLIVVSLLLGKKVMYLFFALLLLFHLMFVHKKKKLFRPVLIAMFIMAAFYVEKISNWLILKSSFWSAIYEKYGLLGTVTSTRSNLLSNSINHINEQWSGINYFFGGIDYLDYRVEFELVDIFLFLGIFGVLVYLLFLGVYFFEKGKNIKNSLLVIILTCSFFSGGLLFSVSCMTMLFIMSKELSVIKPVE